MSSSASDSSSRNGRFSIDLSLELENQLNSELVSPTTSSHPITNNKRESLDPHVLASIIMQLNQDKSRLEAERDDIVRQLSAAHAKEAGLTDTLDILTTRCTTLEEELNAAKVKAKDDEEAITMLRSKVEESRRGLMRLQTENRRQSMGPGQLDMSRTSLASFSTINSSKRQSFTPLTGTLSASRGHRRTSSQSDSPPPTAALIGPSPNGQLLFSDSASITSASHPPVSSRRFSGFFPGQTSASHSDHHGYDPIAAELDGLRRELQTTKDELLDLKHELSEAVEAKEASEQCAAVLRDFIAENNVGVVNIDKPVTTSTPVRPGHEQKKSSGWGFNLWSKEPSPTKSRSEVEAPVSHPLDASLVPKFGGLFGSRASVSSSTNSSIRHKSNLTETSYTSAVSDTSSIENDEPLSPTLEEPQSIDIIVRDPSRSSSSSAEYAHALETPVSKEPPVALANVVENVVLH